MIPNQPPQGNGVILVVDDFDDLRDYMIFSINSWGYSVLTAEDGEEGTRVAKESLPDLILMDSMMPRMTGLEAAKILKADPATSEIPILFVTGLPSPLLKQYGDLILKPFHSDELKRKVERALRARHSS